MSEIAEAKSLRWLANMFPQIDNPQDQNDKMCNAIHIYAERGAAKIDELADLAEHDKEVRNRTIEEYTKTLHEFMCNENCGSRRCVDSMDKCVWYGYICEVANQMKEGGENGET